MDIRIIMRKAMCIMASACAAIGLAVSPAAAFAADSDDASVMKIADTGGDVDTFNPLMATSAASTDVLRLTYDTLLQNSTKDNSFQPSLAKSWKVSDDKLTWTYTLRSGLKWSDGKPLTAKDFAWTYNLLLKHPDLQVAVSIDGVKSVEAPDADTFIIHMVSPRVVNPGGMMVLPEHIWSKIDVSKMADFKNNKDMVGSGPFILDSYDPESGIVLKANPNFWRGKPGFNRIIYVPYKNTDAAVQALKTGEVDLVSGLTPAQFDSLKGQKGIKPYAANNRRYTSIGVNPGAADAKGEPMGDGNPVLKDVKVRQAIAMAIDSKTLIKKVYEGYAQPATGEVPAFYPLYYWNTKDLPLSFDLDKANKLLDETGYKKGPDGIRTDKGGNPIKLRLLGYASIPQHQAMAEYVASWLKDIGIDTDIVMKQASDVATDTSVGKYDLYFTGWGIGADPDWQLSINQCSSRPNADGSGATTESFYCDPAYDKLYEEQHVEFDQAKRSDIVRTMQKMIYTSAVNDVICYQQALVAYRSDKVTGFTPQPENNGIIVSQNGYESMFTMHPVTSAAKGQASSSSPVPWIVGAAIVVVVVGAVVVVAANKRRHADDVE